MKHRIYFSVSSEGFGHSSRDMAIARILQDCGADVLLGSSGYVLDRLKKGFDTVETEKEIEMVGSNGTFDIKENILDNRKNALRFFKIIASEERIIRDFGATCVVADGRWGAVFAAYKARVPCVIIANQTQIRQFFTEGLFLRLTGKYLDLLLRAGASAAKAIIVPDFPHPYTVCADTLGKSRSVTGKQRFTGPVVSINVRGKPAAKKAKKPLALVLLGGHAFRLPLFEGILLASRKLPKMNFLIFTKFKSKSTPKNAVVREFADDISQYMNAADIIITQAGHSTAMEIMALGKPALIVPDKGQAEQEFNARRMKELGVAETLDYGHLEADDLCEKINMLLKDEKYRKNAEKFSRMARRMDGAKKAADTILEFSAAK